jgi:hypothetical protein
LYINQSINQSINLSVFAPYGPLPYHGYKVESSSIKRHDTFGSLLEYLIELLLFQQETIHLPSLNHNDALDETLRQPITTQMKAISDKGIL